MKQSPSESIAQAEPVGSTSPDRGSWAASSYISVRVSELAASERLFLLAFVGFFCQGVTNTIGSIFQTALPFVTPTGFSTAVIMAPLVLSLISRGLAGLPVRILPFVAVYALLLTVFCITVVRSPEYLDIMFDKSWGGSLYGTLFSPLAPVVAFLLVTAAPSVRLVVKGVELAAYLTFVGNLYRFAQASVRGYWIQVDSKGREFAAAYDLGFGYSVLFSVVVFVFLAFAGHRPIVHFMGALSGVLMILLAGSRAPLGIAALAVCLFALYFRQRLFLRSRLRVLLALGLAGIGTMVVINLDQLLLWLQSRLQSAGIESRSLQRLIAGEFTEDRARRTLGQISADLIESGGAFGHGLYGDRYHILASYHWGYPHNIVDEVLITFGWLGGSLLIMAGCFLVIHSMYRARGTLNSDLIILLAPLTFQLWVSLSYLLSTWFWALLGACFLGMMRAVPFEPSNAHGAQPLSGYIGVRNEPPVTSTSFNALHDPGGI